MKNAQLIGGDILLLLAAGLFMFKVTDNPAPAAITPLIVGVSLVASARRS